MTKSEKKKHASPLMTELAALLNNYCMENGSNSPDFILADYLLGCLKAFDKATKRRDKWHGYIHGWKDETSV